MEGDAPKGNNAGWYPMSHRLECTFSDVRGSAEAGQGLIPPTALFVQIEIGSLAWMPPTSQIYAFN